MKMPLFLRRKHQQRNQRAENEQARNNHDGNAIIFKHIQRK